MSDLREKHLHLKRLFSRKKKWGVGVTPQFFLLLKYVFSNAHWKKRIFEKKNLGGWDPPLTCKFGDPLIFRLFVDI